MRVGPWSASCSQEIGFLLGNFRSGLDLGLKNALEFKQRLLHRQPPAVAAKAAAAAQDAVAGDDDRDRVGAAGGAGGADRMLVAGAARHVGVAAGLAIGD